MNNCKLICPVCRNEHDIRNGNVHCTCGAVFDIGTLKWKTGNVVPLVRKIPVLNVKYRL